MTPAWQTRWQRLRRPAAFIAGALLGLYVAGYALLYRRGAAEAAAGGYPGFFYAPVADVLDNWELTRQHKVLGAVYAPLNAAHVRLLDGREAYPDGPIVIICDGPDGRDVTQFRRAG